MRGCLFRGDPPKRKVRDINFCSSYLMFWQPWYHLSCAELADKTIYKRKLKISAMDIMDISTSVLLNGMSESLINE